MGCNKNPLRKCLSGAKRHFETEKGGFSIMKVGLIYTSTTPELIELVEQEVKKQLRDQLQGPHQQPRRHEGSADPHPGEPRHHGYHDRSGRKPSAAELL